MQFVVYSTKQGKSIFSVTSLGGDYYTDDNIEGFYEI